MSRLFLALALVVFIALQFRFWHGEHGLPALVEVSRQVAAYKELNADLERRNEGMRKEIRDLKSGHEAIEARARNELGMVKEGEIFYRIVAADDAKIGNDERQNLAACSRSRQWSPTQ